MDRIEPGIYIEVAEKQCMLISGTTRQVAWLPSKQAKVGSVVTLVDDTVPGRKWRIDSVGPHERGYDGVTFVD